MKLNLDFIQSQATHGRAPLNTLSIGGILSKLTPYIFAGAGLLLLFFLISGGISLMTSRGDAKAAAAAKANITNAAIGFVIVFISYWIVQIVGHVFGITAITNIFK